MKIPKLIKDFFDPYPRIRGACIQCGKCCHSLILTYRRKVVSTPNQYHKLLLWDRNTYERFVPHQTQITGEAMRFNCIHQGKDMSCTVHKSRPEICRTYPHRSIFKLGAELEDGCGYRVVHKGSFEDILSDKIADSSTDRSSGANNLK